MSNQHNSDPTQAWLPPTAEFQQDQTHLLPEHATPDVHTAPMPEPDFGATREAVNVPPAHVQERERLAADMRERTSLYRGFGRFEGEPTLRRELRSPGPVDLEVLYRPDDSPDQSFDPPAMPESALDLLARPTEPEQPASPRADALDVYAALERYASTYPFDVVEQAAMVAAARYAQTGQRATPFTPDTGFGANRVVASIERRRREPLDTDQASGSGELPFATSSDSATGQRFREAPPRDHTPRYHARHADRPKEAAQPAAEAPLTQYTPQEFAVVLDALRNYIATSPDSGRVPSMTRLLEELEASPGDYIPAQSKSLLASTLPFIPARIKRNNARDNTGNHRKAA